MTPRPDAARQLPTATAVPPGGKKVESEELFTLDQIMRQWWFKPFIIFHLAFYCYGMYDFFKNKYILVDAETNTYWTNMQQLHSFRDGVTPNMLLIGAHFLTATIASFGTYYLIYQGRKMTSTPDPAQRAAARKKHRVVGWVTGVTWIIICVSGSAEVYRAALFPLNVFEIIGAMVVSSIAFGALWTQGKPLQQHRLYAKWLVVTLILFITETVMIRIGQMFVPMKNSQEVINAVVISFTMLAGILLLEVYRISRSIQRGEENTHGKCK